MNRIGGWAGRQWAAVEAHLDALVRPTPEFGLELQAERIRTVMRAFYAYLLFLAFPWTSAASRVWTSGEGARAQVGLGLAALVSLTHWSSVRVVGCAVLLLGAALLCLDPRWRLARVSVALAFVFVTALQFDAKGKVDHGNHLAMWTAIGFCFLSRDRRGKAAQRSFVASFFGVQVLIGTLYSCAGICKIIGTFYDGPAGLTWFHPEALPCMITGNWDRSRETLLGGFFVVHPELSMPGQAAAFVLEFGALPAVFFRHLQRPWALGLIALHAMILHTMKIHFHQSCFILVLVLVASPFAPALRDSWRAARTILSKWRAKSAAEPPRGDDGQHERIGGARGSDGLDRSLAARRVRFWGPTLAVVYLVVAFSRFQPSQGAFRQELYPVSPMAMFFRLHPSPEKLEAVQRLRARLERDGLFPERGKHGKAKKKAKKRGH